MSKPKIIGISGTTNSGKTTLSTRLMATFPGSVTINQDAFFREDNDPNHVWITLESGRRHQNWELLESINWDKLKEKINQTLITMENTSGYLIIEGHLVFNYSDFPFSFDHKFFLTLTKDECYRRRITRTYVPPDPPGYFDEIVWPMYLVNKAQAEKLHQDLVFLDGEDDQETIYQTVIKNIKGDLFQTN